jgi:uncharacterized protein YjdB
VIPVQSVFLDSPLYVHEGDVFSLTAEVYPSNATNSKVVFSKDDTFPYVIATIAPANGGKTIRYRANNPGDVYVTVTTEDGGFSDYCHVYVQ